MIYVNTVNQKVNQTIDELKKTHSGSKHLQKKIDRVKNLADQKNVCIDWGRI